MAAQEPAQEKMQMDMSADSATGEQPHSVPQQNDLLQMLAAIISQQAQQAQATVQQQSNLPDHARAKNLKKVNWGLMKTLCPKKLDMDSFSSIDLRSWQRAFLAFAKEAELTEFDWDTQQIAIESAMKPSTFNRVDALRLQLPAAKRQDIKEVVAITSSLIETTKSVWTSRHQFYHLHQKPHQSIAKFHSEVVEKVQECNFDKGFCNQCAQAAIDDHILSKLVFCTEKEAARREMLRDPDLSVEKARKILEADENVTETEAQLTHSASSGVNRINREMERNPNKPRRFRSRRAAQSRDYSRNDREKETDMCNQCGYPKHRDRATCPAKGEKCKSCGKSNHFAKVCRNSGKKPASCHDKPKKTLMGSIICSISTNVDLVKVTIHGQNGHSQVKALIDTGSDWCCIAESELVSVKEDPHNLCPLTADMQATENASGVRMKPSGYFEADIAFGCNVITRRIVVFPGLSGTILSKDALIELSIVRLNLDPPTETTRKPDNVQVPEQKARIITPQTKATDWVLPIVVEQKKNSDDIRLCVNFKPLNKFSKSEVYESPSVLETVQNVQANEGSLFTKFDAQKGYHQLKIAEESKDLTTFITPFGRFRYERAPFGINSISEHYNRRMSESLHGLDNIVRVVDNSLVYGKNDEDHLIHVRAFLERCRERNIRLNEKKFVFRKQEIEFAGVIVSKDGFTISPLLIESLREFPEPRSITDMRSFYGLASQMSPYDPELVQSVHGSPMTNNRRLDEVTNPRLRPCLMQAHEFDMEIEYNKENLNF
ncbi:PREDICTED: uncharacterized protein LOC106811290 [Priapulus caudatus]|uniref:Uncharacterized protein LOC106811290 n=1 Tax=Priapulus caudatus TaxID=37621 RepID=A0ABM1EDS4_PRICU|nr:PREDICTED: uncharacterized protein LOC106811290 [Priapulus caudatus]